MKLVDLKYTITKNRNEIGWFKIYTLKEWCFLNYK